MTWQSGGSRACKRPVHRTSGGKRSAVHQKDIHDAKNYGHKLGVDLPMTDVVCHVMDWMEDNGYVNEDQIAMVRYYEAKMGVTAGEKPEK